MKRAAHLNPRNVAIAQMYDDGFPLRIIAIRFNISIPRAHEICRRLNTGVYRCQHLQENQQLKLPFSSTRKTSKRSNAATATVGPRESGR
jgi:hypothetical protein